MVRIRNEAELDNWFKKNYKKLGFSAIIKDNKGRFPDYIMIEDGKEVRVELEIKSSNFILHNHPIDKLDKVICIEKNTELGIPIIVIKKLKFEKFKGNNKYSLKSDIYNLFKNESVLMTADVAKLLNISWNTAQSHLKDLFIEGEIDRIKKERLNIWLKE